MKNRFRILSVLISMAMLTACGTESNDSQSDQSSKKVEKKAVKKTHLLSEHERALQKAKDVEKELKKADEKRRKALDDAR